MVPVYMLLGSYLLSNLRNRVTRMLYNIPSWNISKWKFVFTLTARCAGATAVSTSYEQYSPVTPRRLFCKSTRFVGIDWRISMSFSFGPFLAHRQLGLIIIFGNCAVCTNELNNTKNRFRVSCCSHYSFSTHVFKIFPAQLAGVFTFGRFPSSKPRSQQQVFYILPRPRLFPSFASRIGFRIPPIYLRHALGFAFRLLVYSNRLLLVVCTYIPVTY